MPVRKALPAQPDTTQLKLADSINVSSAREIYLSRMLNHPQSIEISDSILIKKDSLHIHGGGISLVADSLYHGPAFILSSNCKYILIDSITLQNFDVGFLVHNTALHFKDVQFKNCKLPVEHKIHFPDSKPINGKITDTSFSYYDSSKLKY